MGLPDVHIPEITPLKDGELELITTHINADFDALASMIAASKLYPNAKLVFPGSQEKNLRHFFVESTVYFFNFAKLKNINLKKVRRLIITDTRQSGRIGPLKKVLKNKGLEVHIYDHHPKSPDDIKGDLEVLTPLGSTVTIITEIIRAKGLEITPDEATLMTLGIHEDTGSLTFSSTTVKDYEAAAWLLDQGANLNLVSELITRELTSEQVSLLNEMINAVERRSFSGVEICFVTVSSEHYIGDFAVLVHKLMDMENINALFALAHMEDHVYMVARSRIPEVNAAEITRHFGGGGHPSAAAASIKDKTLIQVEDELLGILTARVEPLKLARDIMAFPVISLKPDVSLTEARDTFTRYDINVIMVAETGGPVLGYISQQNVAKALHHELVDMPIGEFMTTEFEVISPKAGFEEIVELITRQKLRILPVVEDGKPVGIITRTDLLNILASETNIPVTVQAEDEGLPAGRNKNIENLMRERLPRHIIDLLISMGETGDQLGYSVYAIGGFIRDIFIMQENLDIDVVVEGDGIKFAEAFAKEHPGVRARYHSKFNTAVLIFPDGFKVDIATARLEYYESPAALPVVEAGSLRNDLYRRDFTINSLAVKLNPDNFGILLDFFRGISDIKLGYIRVLHNLSFVEDPTRVFRAIRFEQRFGFKIGKLTASLIHNAVKHDFFQKLSGRRLFGELKLILSEGDPVPAIKRLAEFDLLKFIYPTLKLDSKKEKLLKNINKVRDWLDLTYLDESYQPWLVYLLGLIDGLDPEDVVKLSQKLSLKQIHRQAAIDQMPEVHKVTGLLYRSGNLKPGNLFNLLKPLSTEAILLLMAKTPRAGIKKAISGYFTKLKSVKTELGGKYLIDLGLEPGPQFKFILDSLLEARLNGQVSNLEQEKSFVDEQVKALIQ